MNSLRSSLSSSLFIKMILFIYLTTSTIASANGSLCSPKYASWIKDLQEKLYCPNGYCQGMMDCLQCQLRQHQQQLPSPILSSEDFVPSTSFSSSPSYRSSGHSFSPDLSATSPSSPISTSSVLLPSFPGTSSVIPSAASSNVAQPEGSSKILGVGQCLLGGAVAYLSTAVGSAVCLISSLKGGCLGVNANCCLGMGAIFSGIFIGIPAGCCVGKAVTSCCNCRLQARISDYQHVKDVIDAAFAPPTFMGIIDQNLQIFKNKFEAKFHLPPVDIELIKDIIKQEDQLYTFCPEYMDDETRSMNSEDQPMNSEDQPMNSEQFMEAVYAKYDIERKAHVPSVPTTSVSTKSTSSKAAVPTAASSSGQQLYSQTAFSSATAPSFQGFYANYQQRVFASTPILPNDDTVEAFVSEDRTSGIMQPTDISSSSSSSMPIRCMLEERVNEAKENEGSERRTAPLSPTKSI